MHYALNGNEKRRLQVLSSLTGVRRTGPSPNQPEGICALDDRNGIGVLLPGTVEHPSSEPPVIGRAARRFVAPKNEFGRCLIAIFVFLKLMEVISRELER